MVELRYIVKTNTCARGRQGVRCAQPHHTVPVRRYTPTIVRNNWRTTNKTFLVMDSDYFCYCAYVLCISRYSGFLWVVPTKHGDIFARFKTMRRKQNLATALGIQKENWILITLAKICFVRIVINRAKK